MKEQHYARKKIVGIAKTRVRMNGAYDSLSGVPLIQRNEFLRGLFF